MSILKYTPMSIDLVNNISDSYTELKVDFEDFKEYSKNESREVNNEIYHLHERINDMADIIKHLGTQVIVTTVLLIAAITYLFVRGF